MVTRVDGGRLGLEGRLLVMREVKRRLGLADRLPVCLQDPRAPEKVVHRWRKTFRFRVLMDGNDADTLRRDSMFKVALDALG